MRCGVRPSRSADCGDISLLRQPTKEYVDWSILPAADGGLQTGDVEQLNLTAT